MKRRQFIRAATASVFLPAVGKPRDLHVLAQFFPRSDYAFFDERFEKARRLSAGSNDSIAVQGDVTSLWTETLDRATRQRVLQLKGITTESFRFCLAILVSEHARVDLRVFRLDRNLLVWTMHTTPITRAERHHA